MQLFTLAFYKVLNSYCSTSTTDHHYRQNPMKLTTYEIVSVGEPRLFCMCSRFRGRGRVIIRFFPYKSFITLSKITFTSYKVFSKRSAITLECFLANCSVQVLSKDVWIIPITRPALFTRLTILFLFVCILYCSELSFSIKPIVSVSSANLTMEHLRCSVRKSAVYKVNKNGASTVPCGAPVLVFIISEHNKELR
ncbi:hypothetical protein GQR58_020331 [Nymphon striatum]|nr:hypothetical protein GQR58_020331 [Nymphon striatum]